MTGEPAPSGVHLTPSNLRGALRPNLVARLCWSSVRTLTANILPLAIRGQVFDVSAGQKTTSGGATVRATDTCPAEPPNHPRVVQRSTGTTAPQSKRHRRQHSCSAP